MNKIYFSENLIKNIEKNLFKGLKRLNEIYLVENNLTEIHNFTFLAFLRLEYLKLESNQINSFDKNSLKDSMILKIICLKDKYILLF